MATDVTDTLTVPDLGETVLGATLTRWLVAPGDLAAEGDPVAEVEAEKVNVEVPAPFALRILAFLAAEGDQVAVGQPIARVSPA